MKWSKLLCLGMATILSCSSLSQMSVQAMEVVQGEEVLEGIKEYTGEESLKETVTRAKEGNGELLSEVYMEEGIPEAGETEEKVLQEVVPEESVKADNTTEEGLVYKELDDGTMEIIDYTGTATELVVPAEIDGKLVSRIGGGYFDEDYVGAFYGCSSLSSIELPEGLTSIGKRAFYGCSSLSSIKLPEGLTSIGKRAFYGCSSLSSIELPKGLTSIEWSAFLGCNSLKEINVESGNITYASQEGILYDKEKKILICCPEGKTGNIKLLEGLTSIGNSAFFGCSSLSSIELPEGLTSIGYRAFLKCSGISSIELPESVTSIGDMAFYECSSLSSIKLPEGLTSIVNNAFSGCSSLSSIKLPEGVTNIEHFAFKNCSSLRSIELPKGVTNIGHSAFYGCSSLRSIELPKGITSIGDQAFKNCSSLRNIELPKGITSIGNFTFKNCSSLRSIELPEGITSIGDRAFQRCSSLSSIKLPEGVTNIGRGAFKNCDNLKHVTIPASVTNIKVDAFNDCGPDLTLYVVKGSYAESYAKKNGLKYKYIACTHNYQPKTTKATTKKNGTRSQVCTKCGDIKSKTTIYAAKTVKLSKTSYIYNGKAQKPPVSIKDSKGKALKNKTDYTITYEKGRKNVGVYTVEIKFKGNYKGTLKKTFTIVPKSTNITKLTPKKKGFTLKWDKQDKQTTGYEVAYSTSQKFTKKTTGTVTVNKNKTVSKSIGKLKAKKDYYVKIRTFKNVKTSGKTKQIYSGWSKVKRVTTKK